jgi:hypothetical protein
MIHFGFQQEDSRLPLGKQQEVVEGAAEQTKEGELEKAGFLRAKNAGL